MVDFSGCLGFLVVWVLKIYCEMMVIFADLFGVFRYLGRYWKIVVEVGEMVDFLRKIEG